MNEEQRQMINRMLIEKGVINDNSQPTDIAEVTVQEHLESKTRRISKGS